LATDLRRFQVYLVSSSEDFPGRLRYSKLKDEALQSIGLGGDSLLTGSSFAMNRESRGGILSFSSRAARSRFAGREGDARAQRRRADDDVRGRLRQGGRRGC